MNFSCAICSADSGSSLVCRACLPFLSEYQRQKILRAWHKVIVLRDGKQCVYCGHSATWESGELCGNHKETRRVAPEKVFDVDNGECVCKGCNAKFSYSAPTAQKRQNLPKIVKPPACAVSGCPLHAMGSGWNKTGCCWKHQ